MRQLNTGKLYTLPGRVRPLYAAPSGEGYRLYDYRLGSTVPPRFIVRADGRLLDWHGGETPWTVDDLLEVRGSSPH